MDGKLKVQIVVEPEVHADIDILFLHGVAAKWQRTWSRKDSSATWLNDLLPKELPKARILCWGCNLLASDDSGYESLRQYGIKLLDELESLRADQGRPIIFAAHSLGGLVLKQVLVEAQRRRSAISKAVRGVAFFSTPRFTDWEDWAKFSSAIRKEEPGKASAKRFIKLETIDEEFTQIANQESAWKQRICCFFETLPVYRSGILVPKEKATMDGQEECALYADHFTVTRFGAASDTQYQLVCGWLKDMAGQVSQFTKVQKRHRKDSFSFTPTKSSKPVTPDGRGEFFSMPRESEKSCPELMLAMYAVALDDQGQYAKAEEAYRTAINALRQLNDSLTRLTLFCRDKLSNVLRYQSKYDEAQEECQQILKIRCKTSPEADMGIRATAGNLALVMRYRGNYREAYNMLVEKLESTHGIPLTSFEHINIVGLLAKILKDMGYYQFSEYLSREAVQACITLLGNHHPHTLNRLSDLSVVLSKQGKFRFAEETNRYALQGLETQLGMNHPNVLRAAKRQASYLRFQGRILDACAALESILPRQQKKLGHEHPSTLSTTGGLAATYILQGQLDKGKDLLEQALATRTSVLGKSHPDTVWTSGALEHLGSIYDPSSRDSPAELDASDLPEGLRDYLNRPSRPSEKLSEELGGKLRIQQKQDFIPPFEQPSKGTLDSLCRQAAMCGDRSTVEAFWNEDMDINDVGGYCGTLLQAAAYSGNLDLVRLVIQRGADLNFKSGIFHSALKAASLRGHADIVQILLDNGLAINAKGPNDQVERRTSISPLEVATLFGHDDVVSILLDAGADITTCSPPFGSVLHQAAMTGHAKIVRMLLEKGADPNLDNGLFGTPLQEAVNAGNEAMVKLLRAHEAESPSYLDNDSKAKQAAGQLEVVDVLLETAETSAAVINREAKLTEAVEQLTKPRISPASTWKVDPTPSWSGKETLP